MIKQSNTIRKACLFLIMSVSMLMVGRVEAQPLVDTVKAMQKLNDRTYKMLDQLDAYGESYTFTNVIKWKITDPDLQLQIRDALAKEPFNLKKEEFDVSEYYLFSAPAGVDKVEPFHILVRGYNKEKATKKKKGGGFGSFDDDESGNSGQIVPKAYQGKKVVQLFHRTPGFLENVNTIQGENVEIPGEIVPHGSQLVKDAKMRYVYSKMFSQFYSKRAILDAQRAFYGLPTSDASFELTGAAPGEDTLSTPIDPEKTQELPDDQLARARASRYDKLIDLSINHLWINATKNIGFELETGNSEVGLPFWSSGEARVWINLKNQIGGESNVKLGVAFPMDLGDSDLFTFKARKLSGFWGASFDAYFAGLDFFSAFNLPLAVKFSLMPAGQSSNSTIVYNGKELTTNALDGTAIVVPAGKTFYRTSVIAQLYVPTILQLDLSSFLQISVGVGLHNVQQSIIPGVTYTDNRPGKHPLYGVEQANKVQDVKRVSAPVSPHFVVEYVNHKNAKFGLSAGFDHLFTFGGWIELITDHLRLELGYSSPLIRDAKPWEADQFFTITPRIYF